MRRKIYISLIGGLGNQFFQYACAKSLSVELKAKLILDDKIGFIFDKNFKRKIALPSNLNYERISFISAFFFLFLKLVKKIFFRKKLYIKIGAILVLDETTTNHYVENFEKIFKNSKIIYLIGFFQSEKYFLKNKKKILNLILQNKIKNNKLFKFKKKINKKSLMLGLRFFQESPDKIKYNFGGIEKFDFYNNSIKKFKNKLTKFYVFTTSNDNKNIIKKITKKILIINNKSGFVGSDLDYLLLMSNFHNFVISNSSFYWWAAYLAEYKHKIKIIASKKFKNNSTIHNRWK